MGFSITSACFFLSVETSPARAGHRACVTPVDLLRRTPEYQAIESQTPQQLNDSICRFPRRRRCVPQRIGPHLGALYTLPYWGSIKARAEMARGSTPGRWTLRMQVVIHDRCGRSALAWGSVQFVPVDAPRLEPLSPISTTIAILGGNSRD